MKRKFLRFMTSRQGRLGRILMGVVILSLSMFVVPGTPGKIITVVALIPMAGGLFDFCLVGVAMGYPLSGSRVRQLLAGK